MTIHLPEDLARSIREEVLRGHFPSENELVAAAVRDFLQHKQEQAQQTGNSVAAAPQIHAGESSAQDLQRRLLEAGVIREIKAPITDLTPYHNRQAMPIQGESLSQTVLRERR